MKTSDELITYIKKWMQEVIDDQTQYEGLSADWLASEILDDIEQFQAEQKKVSYE